VNARQRSDKGGETSFSPACRSSWRVAPSSNRRSDATETHDALTRRGIWKSPLCQGSCRLVKMGRSNQQELASVHVLPLSQAKRQAHRYIVQVRAKDRRCPPEAQRPLFSIAVVDATNGTRSKSASEVASHSRLPCSPLSPQPRSGRSAGIPPTDSPEEPENRAQPLAGPDGISGSKPVANP